MVHTRFPSNYGKIIKLFNEILNCKKPCRTVSLAGWLYPFDVRTVDILIAGESPDFKRMKQSLDRIGKFVSKYNWDPVWDFVLPSQKRDFLVLDLHTYIRKYFDSYYMTDVVKCCLKSTEEARKEEELREKWKNCKMFFIKELEIFNPKIVAIIHSSAWKLVLNEFSLKIEKPIKVRGEEIKVAKDDKGKIWVYIKHYGYFLKKGWKATDIIGYYDEAFKKLSATSK